MWVPGSFEIPLVAQQMAKSGKFDAVLCIGVVVSDSSEKPIHGIETEKFCM